MTTLEQRRVTDLRDALLCLAGTYQYMDLEAVWILAPVLLPSADDPFAQVTAIAKEVEAARYYRATLGEDFIAQLEGVDLPSDPISAGQWRLGYLQRARVADGEAETLALKSAHQELFR